MEGLISTFHIDVKLIIAQAVNFAIVFAVLYYFAIKPVSKLMRERSRKIEEGVKNAEESDKKLRAAQEDYDRALREAKREAQGILAATRKEADKKRNELMEAAQAEVSAMIQNGKEQLEREKAQMLEEARGEIVRLVTASVEKVVGENIDAGIDRKVVEAGIRGLS